MWFSNWTFIPEDQEATLDPLFFTVPDFHGDAFTVWDRVNCFLIEGPDYDVCKAWYPVDPARNPWMAPGTAPVYSPCGWAGGNPEGCGGVPDGKEFRVGASAPAMIRATSFGMTPWQHNG